MFQFIRWGLLPNLFIFFWAMSHFDWPITNTNLIYPHMRILKIFQNPHIKIDLLPTGQNPLSYYTLGFP
jgi:hypothetical protein